jgi:hypothetical protein
VYSLGGRLKTVLLTLAQPTLFTSNPDKPELNIDPAAAERFVVSLAQRRRLRRVSLCLFNLNR